MRISLGELLSIVLRSSRWVAGALCAGLLAGLILSLMQSPVYLAQATLLPEEVSSSSALSASASERFSLWPMSSTSTQVFYATILRSRAVARMVSERLGYADPLSAPVSLPEHELAVNRIQESVRILEEARDRFSTGGGLITVSVENEDPVLAADIANTYAFVLDEYLTENSVNSASRVRRFLEQRLEETNRELERAQVDLQRFQEQHGAIDIPEQAAATIQLLSELEAQRVSLLAEKAAEEERYSSAHSSVRTLQARIDALQQVIDRLTYSGETRVPYEKEGEVQFFVPLQSIPELSFEAGRKLLALKSKEEIVGLFVTRLEQAKIDEASNLPSVSVLDLAQKGTRVRPKRKMNVAVGGLLGLVFGCLGSWGTVYGRRVLEEAPEDSALRDIERTGRNWGRQVRTRGGDAVLRARALLGRTPGRPGPDQDVGHR